jgi:hypothetical protein
MRLYPAFNLYHDDLTIVVDNNIPSVTLLDDVSIETMAVNTVLLNTAFLQATSIGESSF